MRKPGRQQGYTVLELVIVASVVGLLLVIGTLDLRLALAREQTEGWARSITYDIAAGQQAALTRRATVTATFQNQTYTIAVSGGGVLRQDTLPSHITFGSTLVSMSFDRRGVPSSSMTLTIASTSGRSYQITVQSGTGRVTFQ